MIEWFYSFTTLNRIAIGFMFVFVIGLLTAIITSFIFTTKAGEKFITSLSTLYGNKFTKKRIKNETSN